MTIPKPKPKHKPAVSLPLYEGPYAVGISDFEVPVSHLSSYYAAPDPKITTVHFAIFYPCEKPDHPSEPVTWIPSPQKKNMRAFSRFMGVSPRFSRFFSKFPRRLYKITLPAHRNAVMLQPPQERWPVLFFSHGIGGTRHTYSHLLGSLASYGVVVIAPDHRDGSGPFANIRNTAPSSPVTSESSDIDLHSHRSHPVDSRLSNERESEETTFIDYDLIPHKFNEEVMAARRRQLNVRLWEIALVFEAVCSIDIGYDILQPRKSDTNSLGSGSSTTSFKGIFEHLSFANKLDIHEPGKVVWAGHSFGAATTVQFVKTAYYSYRGDMSDATHDTYEPLLKIPKEASILSQITPQTQVCLLDMWTYPLLDLQTRWLWNQPLPCYHADGPGGEAVLSIVSDAFTRWNENYRLVKKATSDSPASHGWETDKPHPHAFYARFSAHVSQSDFGLLFPYIVKKFLKAKEPERLLSLNVRSILQMMSNNGAPVAPFKLTVEDFLKKKQIKLGEGLPSDTQLEGHHILSRERCLRDWFPVAVDETQDLAFDIDEEFDLNSGITFLPNKKKG